MDQLGTLQDKVLCLSHAISDFRSAKNASTDFDDSIALELGTANVEVDPAENEPTPQPVGKPASMTTAAGPFEKKDCPGRQNAMLEFRRVCGIHKLEVLEKLLIEEPALEEGVAGALPKSAFTPACGTFVVQTLKPILTCLRVHCANDKARFVAKHGEKFTAKALAKGCECPAAPASGST